MRSRRKEPALKVLRIVNEPACFAALLLATQIVPRLADEGRYLGASETTLVPDPACRAATYRSQPAAHGGAS